MAELPSAVKNQMSHRARAAQAVRLFLHKLATNH
jgi:inosine/xanthosine triphosphate pyrophosphatase family protein